jgi:hypothetical protein
LFWPDPGDDTAAAAEEPVLLAPRLLAKAKGALVDDEEALDEDRCIADFLPSLSGTPLCAEGEKRSSISRAFLLSRASKWLRSKLGLTENAALVLSGGSRASAPRRVFLAGLEVAEAPASPAVAGEPSFDVIATSLSLSEAPGRVKGPFKASSTTAFSEADTDVEGRAVLLPPPAATLVLLWKRETGPDGGKANDGLWLWIGGSPTSEERLLIMPLPYAEGETLGGGGGGANRCPGAGAGD